MKVIFEALRLFDLYKVIVSLAWTVGRCVFPVCRDKREQRKEKRDNRLQVIIGYEQKV
jgi:hypothetical protein